ncbi:MAG: flagellar hook-associated protein FlgK [Pseudolabrys sp.]
MSLTQALSAAISGLKVNQQALSLVAANVANADTPGYVRKTVNQVTTAANNTGLGVRISEIQRELDQYVQRQLRTESAGASYATQRAQFYQRLQDIYGTPGTNNTLETVYNKFTAALQSLATSPDDPAARSAVISAAQVVAQQLNQMSTGIQGLRADAELGISDAVSRANQAMSQIALINQKIAASSSNDTSMALLLDQRDAYIDQLSQLMDINVIRGDGNQITVFTNSGVQLVGTQAARLQFDAQGTMSAASTWSADPTERTVGTIMLVAANGGTVDLIQSNAIRSGEIAAYLQMRDQDLVQAQTQLDAIAAAMASALSDKTTAGTAVTSGLQDGFTVDIGGLSAGNTISLNYTVSLTGATRTMTFVRVDDPSVLPLSGNATATPGDTVVGIDFSGGMASVLAQINSAIASTGMVASNPIGNDLQILDDGAGNIVNVNSLTVTKTATSLAGGSAELPFFTDGSQVYSGAIGALGAQSVGFAGRITVNSALAGDASRLVVFASGVAAGDSTRPDFILQKLTTGVQQFSPATGIGTESTPFSGSITTFMRQVLSYQGDAADSAINLKQGQDVVLNALQQRFNDSASVNVDQEMANLLTLQNAYAANARVLSAVNEMLKTLMQM